MSFDPMVHHVLALAGALLFATAAWHKLRAPAAFGAALSAHRLLPARLVRPFAQWLPLLELALAGLLLVPATAPVAAIPASLLMVLYGAVIAINLLRGRRDLDCGCGGPGGERPLSWGLVVRNLALASGLGALVLPVSARPLGSLDAVHALLTLATAALLYSAVDVALANAARSRLAPGAV